jgi:hypothetical protein
MNDMEPRLVSRSFVVLGFVALAACQLTPPAAPPLTDAERNQIGETITRLAASVDVSHDRAECEAQLGVFAGLEPVVASGGMTIRTVEALKAFCPHGTRPHSRFDVTQTDIHVFSRDVAYIVRTGTLIMKLGLADEERSRYTVTQIFTRVGNDWKMAHHHESFLRL